MRTYMLNNEHIYVYIKMYAHPTRMQETGNKSLDLYFTCAKAGPWLRAQGTQPAPGQGWVQARGGTR
jgi:hypothetical protein